MRKLLWLLLALPLLWLPLPRVQAQQGSPTGPPYNFFCNQSIPLSWSVAAVGSTVVPGIAGKGIYICGWHATTGNTSSQSTFQLASGTTLATSAALTPPLGVTSTAPSVDHIDYAAYSTSLFAATSSPSNVFINISGAGTNIQFVLYYGQY